MGKYLKIMNFCTCKGCCLVCLATVFSVYVFPTFSTTINATSADCDSDTLTADTGTANLTAQWEANTIGISWYNDGQKITGDTNAATSCEYDTLFSLPTAPTKTGYSFAGWKVAQYNFSTIPTDSNGDERWGKGVTTNNTDYCYYKSGTGSASHVTCDSSFDDLKKNGWKVRFGTSMVYGIGKCSTTAGTVRTAGNPSDVPGNNCWCKAIGYKPSDEDVIRIPESRMAWVSYSSSTVSNCSQVCSTDCTYSLLNTSAFRVALYTLSPAQ